MFKKGVQHTQLCDQFMIRRNYAKTFQGFKTRILANITTLILVQFINNLIFDRPINNIKNQILKSYQQFAKAKKFLINNNYFCDS